MRPNSIPVTTDATFHVQTDFSIPVNPETSVVTDDITDDDLGHPNLDRTSTTVPWSTLEISAQSCKEW